MSLTGIHEPAGVEVVGVGQQIPGLRHSAGQQGRIRCRNTVEYLSAGWRFILSLSGKMTPKESSASVQDWEEPPDGSLLHLVQTGGSERSSSLRPSH